MKRLLISTKNFNIPIYSHPKNPLLSKSTAFLIHRLKLNLLENNKFQLYFFPRLQNTLKEACIYAKSCPNITFKHANKDLSNFKLLNGGWTERFP